MVDFEINDNNTEGVENKEVVKRVDFLGVPVDILPETGIEDHIMELLQRQKALQIIFLDQKSILKARKNRSYMEMLEQAGLVVPVQKKICHGLKKQKHCQEIPPVYMPFELIIKILSILERHKKSAYLIGEKVKHLQVAYSNISDSFPDLQIVGRFHGFFSKNESENVITAIRKASPALVIGGTGLKKGENWFFKHRQLLNSGLLVYSEESFAIFSHRREKPTRKQWERSSGYSNIFRHVFDNIRYRFIYLLYCFRR